jgi:hypothetical protein
MTIVITSATSATLYYSQTTNSSPSGFGTLLGTYTITNSGGFIGLVGDALGSSYITYWDNIIVRKYASPEPTWGVWGADETPSYSTSNGTIASGIFDTGHAGARWDLLAWDNASVAGTSVIFEARVSDVQFVSTNITLSWQSVSNNPNLLGRYQQWRATLSTNNSSVTPILNEVRSLYSW